MAVFSLIFAGLTKWINPMVILRTALSGMTLIFLAIYSGWLNVTTPSMLYLWVVIISLVLAGVNGLFFAILADLFPTQVRYSGIAVCYNIAYILGAGITPLWTSSILEFSHNYSDIMLVCLIIAIISLANTYNIKKLTNYH